LPYSLQSLSGTNVEGIISGQLRETGKVKGRYIVGCIKNIIFMAEAYIEHRPHASSEHVPTSHYVIMADGEEIGHFATQSAAKKAACEAGYDTVHVARQRHLQDRRNHAHWRKDPC
jgi:hypothetical protein